MGYNSIDKLIDQVTSSYRPTDFWIEFYIWSARPDRFMTEFKYY